MSLLLGQDSGFEGSLDGASFRTGLHSIPVTHPHQPSLHSLTEDVELAACKLLCSGTGEDVTVGNTPLLS